MTTQTLALGSGAAARNRRRSSPRSQQLRLRSCGLTDTGYERPRNEDRFDLDDRRRLYVLADGIGSYRYGNVAAQIAVESILESVRRESGVEACRDRLEPAIRYAHARICEAGRRDPSLEEMGTTVVSLLFDETGSAVVAHAGDSRAYRWRDGELELLTRDHTYAAEMLAEGLLSEADVENGPWANVLTRALSVQGPLDLDTATTSARNGDAFLLCSDGLTKMLSDREIQDCLERGGGPDEICRRLIGEALMRGGLDNVTVVLVEIHTPGAADDDDTQTVTVEIPIVTATAAGVAPAVC
jgi:PPM family protein phosphatase